MALLDNVLSAFPEKNEHPRLFGGADKRLAVPGGVLQSTFVIQTRNVPSNTHLVPDTLFHRIDLWFRRSRDAAQSRMHRF